MKELRQVKLDLAELEYAFDNASWTMSYFLDIETGEVVVIPVDDMDDEDRELAQRIDEDLNTRYLPVPHPLPRDGYMDMENFIEDLDDQQIARHLAKAIGGRGAFRCFKDILSLYPEEEKKWFEYKSACLRKRVKEWLESEGITPIPT